MPEKMGGAGTHTTAPEIGTQSAPVGAMGGPGEWTALISQITAGMADLPPKRARDCERALLVTLREYTGAGTVAGA